MLVAYLIAGLIPVGVLIFIYKLNFYRTGSGGMVGGAFVWGLGAYGIAALINSQIFLRTGLIDSVQLAQFITPWEEEILKAALFILFLSKVENTSQFADWAIYGFAIGIGFAVIENFEYVHSYQYAAINVAVSRVISTNLIHASATALAGTAFGLSRFHSGFKKILVILRGLLLGILIHFVFNNIVNTVNSSLLLVYAAGIGIGVTVIIYFMIRKGLVKTKEHIKEKLGMLDRVTKSESRLVQEYKSAKSLLEPLIEMFGKSDGEKANEFLEMQARIGIHRKNLEKFPDEKLIESTRLAIETLQKQMNEIRVNLGPYKMAMIRTIFPENEIHIWGNMQSLVDNRAKDPDHKRGGLFDSLDGKVRKTPDQQNRQE